jgi:hypothetical protein
VNSYDELLDLLEEIIPKKDKIGNNIPLYRGQTKDYGNLFPSAARKDIQAQFLYEWVLILKYLLNHSDLDEILKKNGVIAEDCEFGIIQLLLQHYGSHSRMLDVSSKLEIALWFAFHEAIAMPPYFLISNEVLLAERSLYTYNRKYDDPLIYLFSPYNNDSQSGDEKYSFIDLSKIFPLKNTRIQKQSAHGVYFNILGELDGIDIAEAEIKLNFDYKDLPTDVQYSMNQLFPSYKEDRLLRILLSVPYIGSASQLDILHRLIDVTLFFNDEIEDNEILEYLYTMNEETSVVPLFHFSFRRYANLFIDDVDTFPTLRISNNKIYPINSSVVFKIHSPMWHYFEIIRKDQKKYLDKMLKFQSIYNKFTDTYGKYENSVFFELSDLDIISYCSRIKSIDTPYFLTGVWGVCEEDKVALRGLYVRHDENGNPEFGLSSTSVWNINCNRQNWNVEKFYDNKKEILSEIDPISISDDQLQRAHNIMNIWSANILLTVLGEFKPFMPSYERYGKTYTKMLELYPEIDKSHCKRFHPDYTFLRLDECLSRIHNLKI